LAAAEKALKSFVQFPNASDAHKVLGPQVVSTDFTSDVSVDPQDTVFFNNFAAPSNTSPSTSTFIVNIFA
jgi:double stranded RNA-specific editase B